MQFKDKLPAAHVALMRRLLDAGHEVYFVGGAVRDLVLGLEPKDFDLTTSATPDEVKALFPGADLVGAHFGVTLVPMCQFLRDKVVVEVATYRTDASYSDHRRPDFVGLTRDAKEDLLRRDFTMNALLMTVDGEVLDHVGGLDDLKLKRVRTVGNPVARFKEDPVRMLRMVRFAARLGFVLQAGTATAAFDTREHLKHVAVERVAKELNGVLLSGHAAYGFELLRNLGLLQAVAPEVPADHMRATNQSALYHPEGNVWNHTLLLLNNVTPDTSLDVALAALLHDVGKPLTARTEVDGRITFKGHEEFSADYARRLLSRLRYPAATVDNVVDLVANHMRVGYLDEMRRAKQLRFVRKQNFGQQLELHRLDAMGSNQDLSSYRYGLKLLVETPEETLKPARLVTGFDLKAMGLNPGPSFRLLLTAVEDGQLEGLVTTREQALEVVRVMRDIHAEMEGRGNA